jgi:lysozyme
MQIIFMAALLAASPSNAGAKLLSNSLIEQIKSDEGFKRRHYMCSENHCTIGYGYNLESNALDIPAGTIAIFKRDGITQGEAHDILIKMLQKCQHDLFKALPWVEGLSQARQDALVNMVYQMGIAGVMKFKNSLRLIEQGKYGQAGVALMLSRWARQTPNRAARISKMISNG